MCFLFQTFILQLEGKTKWKLFKPLQELPQEASPDLELSDLGEPTDEFDMEVHVLAVCDCAFHAEMVIIIVLNSIRDNPNIFLRSDKIC